MKNMAASGQALGVSQPTLRRYVRLLSIKPYSHPLDASSNALTDERIEQIRDAICDV